MPQRATAHAARRRASWLWTRAVNEQHAENGTAAMVSADWDATTYDDVIPHRLRGTLRLDDDGEPAALVDLVADRRMS
jgi:hypothetical protein